MQRSFSLLLLLACVAVFVLGLAELFKLRFDSGDVYPAYSSLRYDPLGSSAFYESLARMPGISVSRDFRMSDEMPDGRNIAYLHLAGKEDDWEWMPEAQFKDLESFVKRGGRLVVAFFPEVEKPYRYSTFPSPGKTNSIPIGRNRKPVKKPTQSDDEYDHEVSLKEKWGFDFDFTALKPGDGGAYEPATVQNNDEPSLPATIRWHSGMIFKKPDSAWRYIYSRGADPVLMERRLGSGSVVFSSDAFFLSNEAMSKDRHADLLAWVVGPCRSVMFDEAHLGIVNNPGIATLVRKYRLHGLVVGLLLLAGLFIWKNSLSFVPPHAEQELETHVAGKDSAAGFINLLRRHIPAGDVLATCLTEWTKSFPKGKVPTARLERVQAVINAENALPPKERHPIRTYQAICKALKEPGNPH